MDASFTAEEIRTIVVPVLCAMIPQYSAEYALSHAMKLAENILLTNEARMLAADQKCCEDQSKQKTEAFKKFEEMKRTRGF